MRVTPLTLFLLSAILFTILFTQTCFATGMRCGKKVVARGDRPHEVLSKCGPPTFKESETRWVYVPHKAKFSRTVVFSGNHRVHRIDYGPKT